MTVAIVIAFSMPQAEAVGEISIPAESSKTAEVGTIISYTGFRSPTAGQISTTLSVSCVSPATATISPTVISGAGGPFVVEVSSSVAGTFECTITAVHTGLPTRTLIVTSTFTDPPPPPVMCGPGTILGPDNKCIPDSDEVIMCGPGTILNDENKCVPDFANICGEGTVLNDENKCIPDPDEVIMCGPGTILNDENKCVPDFANICGEGTILNDDNQCVPEPKKVDVCHKGKKTINISSNAVPAHLAHGDTLGQCS